MRRITTFKQLLAALPILALAGCGGSSGVSDGYPTGPSTTVPNPTGPGIDGGSTMAKWYVGQTWKYNVSGTITEDVLNNGNAKQTVTGKVQNGFLVRVVAAAPSNFPAGTFEVTDTFTYTLQGGVPTTETTVNYYVQAPDGSIQRLGADKYQLQTQFLSGSTYFPGVFSASSNLAANPSATPYNPPIVTVIITPATPTTPAVTAQVNAGAVRLADTFTALDQEQVPSSTGAPFLAWRSKSTETSYWNQDPGYFVYIFGEVLPVGWTISSQTTVASTDWWVPSLGAPVKSHVNVTGWQNVNVGYSLAGTNASNPEGSITFSNPVVLNKTESLDLSLYSRSNP